MVSDSLGRSASRGGLATFSGQLVRLAIYGVGVVVLGRLLSPSDYGLMAMVVAVVGLGEVIREFGLSFAAVQAAHLSQAQRSNLFWISSGLGALLAIVTFFASWPLASFYSEPAVVPITQALSVSFLFSGISAQLKANLTRELRFSSMAVAEVVAPFLGLAFAILIAVLGGGYWALVCQQVTIQLVLMAYYIIANRWRPSLYSREASVRSLVANGASILGVQVLSYASRNVDSIVIGATMGPRPAGVYNMAFQLMILPLNQINAPSTSVAFPVLSRLQQNRERFNEFLERGQLVMVTVIVGCFGLVVPLAPLLIPLIVGDQWHDSVPLFQILAVGGVAQAVSYATYWVFLSLGLFRSQLFWSLATRPIIVVCVILGANWGTTGVALGYALPLLALWPLGIFWVSRVSFIRPWTLFWTGARTIIVFAVCGFAAWGASLLPIPPALAILAGAAAYVSAYGFILLVSPRIRSDVGEISHSISLIR